MKLTKAGKKKKSTRVICLQCNIKALTPVQIIVYLTDYPNVLVRLILMYLYQKEERFRVDIPLTIICHKPTRKRYHVLCWNCHHAQIAKMTTPGQVSYKCLMDGCRSRCRITADNLVKPSLP
jgi:hypothetical protein